MIKNITGNDSNTFASLILDITIETSEKELADYLSDLEPFIESGKLNVFLCKSNQKYATLGSGKIMSGNVSVFNNGDAKFSACIEHVTQEEKSLDIMNYDETQLMTHMLKYAQKSEITAITQAAENAEYLQGDRVLNPVDKRIEV